MEEKFSHDSIRTGVLHQVRRIRGSVRGGRFHVQDGRSSGKLESPEAYQVHVRGVCRERRRQRHRNIQSAASGRWRTQASGSSRLSRHGRRSCRTDRSVRVGLYAGPATAGTACQNIRQGWPERTERWNCRGNRSRTGCSRRRKRSSGCGQGGKARDRKPVQERILGSGQVPAWIRTNRAS